MLYTILGTLPTYINESIMYVHLDIAYKSSTIIIVIIIMVSAKDCCTTRL